MSTLLSKVAPVVLVGALLAGCQSPQTTSTSQFSQTSSSSSSVQATPAVEEAGTVFIEGNDDIGYITFSSKVITFMDLNHDESIANTRQWTNPENMNILSLTSFDKAGYTDMLKQAGDQAGGMSETDAIISINLEAFAGVEGVDIALERDLFNDLFHESSISVVSLPNGMVLASVSFIPKADSQKLYLLSTEGTDKGEVLSWLGEVLPTWTAKKPN